MTMTAKFNGTCKSCGCSLPAGSRIDWTREGGARHVTVNDCAAAKAAKASAPVAVPVPAVTVSGAPIANFLRAAKERGLKFPKVAFLGPNNSELVLSLAGAASKNPGAVFVKVDGEFVGSICADDSVRGRLARRDDLLALLNTIAGDPATAAAAYGRMRGNCSFCRKSLTDDRTGGSIEVGYGPVCARKYGLPHAPKGKTRKLAPVVAPAAHVDEYREDYPGQYVDGPDGYDGDGPQEPAEAAFGPADVPALFSDPLELETM